MKNKKTIFQHGFTLVELQIAILVLLLIFSVIGGVLYYVSKSWTISDSFAERHNRQHVVINLLRQQISGMLPVQNKQLSRSEVCFEGQSDELTYVGSLPVYLVKGGPWIINIGLNDAKQLMLRYQYFNSQRPVKINIQDKYSSVVLLEEVEQFSVRYLSNDGVWQQSWVYQNALPNLIKIELIQEDSVSMDAVIPVYAAQAGDLPVHQIKK